MSIMKMYVAHDTSCTATKLSKDNLHKVTELLSVEVRYKRIADLEITVGDVPSVSFRYADTQLTNTLTTGSYLVMPDVADARYGVMSDEEFNKTYSIITADEADNFDASKTFKQALTAFIQTNTPELRVTSEFDISDELLLQLGEKLKGWYDEAEDTFTINMMSWGIRASLRGIGNTLNILSMASYLKDTTYIHILLGNDGSASCNEFDYIQLNELLGEFRDVDQSVLYRLRSLSFVSLVGEDSSIAGSVSGKQWSTFVEGFKKVTKIISAKDIVVRN